MEAAGVIFDMDGVLIDSYQPHFRSWCLLSEELGRTITEAEFAATFGKTSRDSIGLLFGVFEDAEARRLDDRKEALYRDLIRKRIPAMTGAMACLVSLRAAGFKLAVGSSGPPENVSLVCEEMRLDRLLSAIVTGADVQRGKPDPQVFVLAAMRMFMPAARCVVVEDAPAGIEAAHRAGMKAIGLTSTHSAETLTEADVVIDRLDQLVPELVHSLLR